MGRATSIDGVRMNAHDFARGGVNLTGVKSISLESEESEVSE
jgi:hypothetical protein